MPDGCVDVERRRKIYKVDILKGCESRPSQGLWSAFICHPSNGLLWPVGSNEGTITACFWDIQTSGQSLGGSYGISGKTTAEMQIESTFTDAVWDFVGESVNGTEDIWSICEGTNYPRLAWQIPAGDFVCPDGITIEDFVFFIEHWRDETCDPSNDYCQGTDLDFSGTVDEADLEILVDNWLAVGN